MQFPAKEATEAERTSDYVDIMSSDYRIKLLDSRYQMGMRDSGTKAYET
jgi:hypothetical protein